MTSSSCTSRSSGELFTSLPATQKFLSVVLGTGLMVLCCAPIALVLFGTAGLAALAGYLDYLLFAALAIGLPLYARYHKRKQDAGFTNEDSEKRDD